jgi:hypothetical protein
MLRQCLASPFLVLLTVFFLHVCLSCCSVVDDESIRERPYNDALPTPEEWDLEYDPVRLFTNVEGQWIVPCALGR